MQFLNIFLVNIVLADKTKIRLFSYEEKFQNLNETTTKEI